MTLEVLLFGPHARAAGRDRVSLSLPGSATPASILAQIGGDHPSLGPLLAGARIAVNARFVAEDTLVGEGDELALVGLVGGG